ncbi:MAG: hypothetical protein [Caudoviricetes sp.]|nr:MAG: hypothetical protein [Caudoviricetes sp.]
MNTMTTTVLDQLATVITNTDANALSEKLNNYCLDHLECLQELIEELSQNIFYTFDYYLIDQNDLEMWDNQFDDVADALEAVGSDYRPLDRYIYLDNSGLYESCNYLSDFYSPLDVANLTATIIKELKKDTEKETKRNIDYLINWSDLTKVTPTTLLEILEN